MNYTKDYVMNNHWLYWKLEKDTYCIIESLSKLGIKFCTSC